MVRTTRESSSSTSSSSSFSSMMNKPWSKSRWSNIAREASNNFFNYPSALFTEDQGEQPPKQPPKQNPNVVAPPDDRRPDADTDTDSSRSSSNRDPNAKEHNTSNNNRNESCCSPCATPNGPRKENEQPSSAASTPLTATLPTAVKGYIAENCFHYSSALFGDKSTKPRTPPARAAAATSSGTPRDTPQFFNFPSALFRHPDPSPQPPAAAADLREQRGDGGRDAEDLDRQSANDDSEPTTTAAARKRLAELEDEIEVLRHTIESSDNRNNNNNSDNNNNTHNNNHPRLLTAASTEAITQIFLRLDAIEIPRTETALRTKRKELLQRAEALDPTSSSSSSSSSSSTPPPEEPPCPHPETNTAEDEYSRPSAAAGTETDDRFDAIERDIRTLEGRILDNATTGDTNQRLDRTMVEELVTQLICKLDGVGVDLPPSGSPRETSGSSSASRKARRKQLLRRAEAIETTAFQAGRGLCEY